MDKEEEIAKEIKELKEKLKDREDALPAHSVKPQQMLIIDESKTAIEEKKNELAELKKKELQLLKRVPYFSLKNKMSCHCK